jgi:hypothetical protein
MVIKKWLHQDEYWLGIFLGLIIPIPAYLLFGNIVKLIQSNLHVFERVRQMDLLLLGLAVNLIVMRYYLVKLKYVKTGKAMLLLTVIMILLFFIFLKNSNFVLPI